MPRREEQWPEALVRLQVSGVLRNRLLRRHDGTGCACLQEAQRSGRAGEVLEKWRKLSVECKAAETKG